MRAAALYLYMHQYFIKIPWLVKKLFPLYTWKIPNDENAVFLTFDDGPHPTITPWVLDQLAAYNALATFFCIGKNVADHREVHQRIIKENHSTGNHTYHHLNGWKTINDDYREDVKRAATLIESGLFRPPYGKIKRRQAKDVFAMLPPPSKIVMWDVLSSDFDTSVSGEQCLDHVMKNVTAGSIVVFHDSEKAFVNLKYALPRALKNLSDKGFIFKKIE